MTTQKHSREPRPTTATKADGNAQEAQADYSPKYSLGAWGVVVPPSAVPVNINTELPTQEEHKRLLREAGCASDIFTARTPEELHAIADAELVEMTKTPPTQRGFELLKSWRDFRLEMIRCAEYNRPWVKYIHRDANEILEIGEGMFHQRITVKMKVDEVFKAAIYRNSPQAQLEKAIDDWSLEALMTMPYLEPMKEKCIPDDALKDGDKIGRLTINHWGKSLSWRTDEHKEAGQVEHTDYTFTTPKIWDGLAVLIKAERNSPGSWVDMNAHDKDFPRRFQSKEEKEFRNNALEHGNTGGKSKGKLWRIRK